MYDRKGTKERKKNMRFKVLDNDMIKNQKNRLKENVKGITLIALVVTIVVLLILARSKYFNVNW